MKSILKLIVLLFILTNANAQRILPLEEDNFGNMGVSGNYYKDLDHEMNYFVGTWMHDDGNMQFKITIKKEEGVPFNGSLKDMLVGEYSLTIDGVEKINTLTLINQRAGRNHLIHGNSILYNCRYPDATQCRDGDPRFRLTMKYPDVADPLGNIYLHKPANETIGNDQLIGSMSFKYYSSLNVGETVPEIDLPWKADFKFIRQ